MRKIVERMKREVAVYRLVLEDARTPRISKWLLGLTIAYALSPVDLIPDFIPLVGYLDDVILVPVLFWLALRLIPNEVIVECRNKAVTRQ